LISNNIFYSNGCTTFAVCNTRHIPPGGGQGIYVAAGNNTFENNSLGNSGISGFEQYYGIFASQVDSPVVTNNTPVGHLSYDYYFNGATNVLFSDTRKTSQYKISSTGATFLK
jgi:hypothetical protein